MENSQQPLATESFSYSWLLNRKPSIDGLTESPRPSYSSDDDHDNDEEEDMKFIAYSKRFLEEAQNFNFDVHPVSESVHADEIFSDGHIMPRYLDKSKIESFREAFNNFNINSSVPSSSTHPTPRVSDSTTTQADFLEKWRKFSRRVLVKWFGYIRPISKRISSSRKSTAKVDDLQRKVSEIQSCKTTDSSFQGSPPHRIMKSHSVVDWTGTRNDQRSNSTNGRVKTLRKVKSWSSIKSPQAYNSPPSYDHSNDVWRDMESAVSDAILHCKRSFGMLTEPDINLDDHFDKKKQH